VHGAAPAGGETRERGRMLADSVKANGAKRPTTDTQQEVDRVRLVQRLSKALQTAQERGGTLRLRLTPPELGALKIELKVQDGALSAKLEAETPAARTAILENLPALRERLTAQEIKIDRFDVDLMQQSDHGGGEHSSFADAESSRERAAQRGNWRNDGAETKLNAPTAERPTIKRGNSGQLNVLA
jgi:flagellar hook-length control protein FliK